MAPGEQSSCQEQPRAESGGKGKGENSLLELMLTLRHRGRRGGSVSPMLQIRWEGAMGGSGEGLQVLGSSWVTPSLQSCVCQCLHHREHRWVVLEGLADLQSPALWLTVKGLL